MNKYDTFKTPKGTELPLMNLKGKPYMQVAHRLVWFTEAVASYSVETNFPVLTSDETVAHVKVSVYDNNGKMIKSSSAVKRETKKDFSDHTEKAETGAIGRALALLGYGTQFAIADLDEGERLADSPVATVVKTESVQQKPETISSGASIGLNKKPTFQKKNVTTSVGDDI